MPALKRKSTNESSASSKRARVDGGSTAPAPFPAGPGGPMEIVFSFDTTGSMSSCLVQVRKNLTDMINRLQKDIPGLRMAVFAHGDYCARNYVTKYVDFTNDVTKLVDFVNNVSVTGGGDPDECYELVLHEVRTKLSWSAGTQRSLVMIGDANPHGPKYPQNTLKLDWKKETNRLSAEGVHIYGVNCGNSSCADFYKSLASKTDGKYLRLKDWNNIFDMMMAICYREHGVELFKAYEHEVRSRGPVVSREMDVMLKALRHGDDDVSDESDDTTGAPAAPGLPGTAVHAAMPPPLITPIPASPVKKQPVRPKKPKAPKRSAVKASTKTAIKKPYRERFGKHPFTSLFWSRWERLISKTKPNNRLAKNWIPTRNGVTGFRRIGLFKDDAQKPAFYEVGVKLPESQKIYATFFRVTNGFKMAGHIDTFMFKSGHLTTQINDVISKGCDVYIRRANLPTKYVDIADARLVGVKAVRDFVSMRVEYAWNKGVYGRRRHRLIVRKDIKISSDKI